MMKNKFRKQLLASLLLTALILTGCGRKGAEVSETAGVGRPMPETTADGTPVETDSSQTSPDGTPSESGDQTPSSENTVSSGERFQNGKLWDFVDGKYIYSFPERDDSGLATVSELNSVWGLHFPDSNMETGDWYTGRLIRNLQTGEITVKWDRTDETIGILNQYRGIYKGNTEEKVCYFTFDCGYEYGTTSKILDTLKEKKVPALFFVTGQYVKEEDELIQRMLDEGHIVGNHSVNHKQMAGLSAEEFQKELTGLEDLFYAKFPDAPPMLYYRPPSGDMNQWSLRLADKMGYTSVLWSTTYLDYDTNNQKPVAEALQLMKEGLHNGAVYLLHAESQTNADMLGDLIDWIRDQGYTILPICDIEFE